jgi:hypothetical protein
MFRLLESSSGQLLNHVEGTSSGSAHFWDPKMLTAVRERGYKRGWYLIILYTLKHIHVFLKNWPDEDSVSRNMSPL